jgi:hypothetical protein
MSSQDWQVLSNSLTAGIVKRGSSEAITPPSGGGTHMYGMNSLQAAAGVVGLYYNADDFAPADKGGSVRAVIRRVGGARSVGFSPFLFMCLSGGSVDDNGYMLGLEDRDPYRIVLTKGALTNGVQEAAENTYLRRSSSEYRIADGAVHQIRLDVIVQNNGDVTLKVMENDLNVNDADSPVWEPIGGMSLFVDDVLGVNSYLTMGLTGSDAEPYTGGYMGFGTTFVDQVAVATAFDMLQFRRQL